MSRTLVGVVCPSELRDYSGHVCQHWKVQKATDELAVGCELTSKGESAMRGTDVYFQSCGGR